MTPTLPPDSDPRQRRRWFQQHLLLGLLQLACAVAAVFSLVLTAPESLAGVHLLTWLLAAALVVVSAVRLILYFARGRPTARWLEDSDQ
jgi:uncharacterized membrane protein HdeD (DUF308 family)